MPYSETITISIQFLREEILNLVYGSCNVNKFLNLLATIMKKTVILHNLLKRDEERTCTKVIE